MKKKAELKGLHLSGPVRITLPAKVAYDLNSLQSSIATIMEQIGCAECFSGADCDFRLEREFVINPEGQVGRPNPIILVGASDRDGDSMMPVNVVLAPEVRYDINLINDAIARVVDIIGGHPCFSGFDFYFRRLELVTVDQQLNVNTFGQL